jgi:hypothetical protein
MPPRDRFDTSTARLLVAAHAEGDRIRQVAEAEMAAVRSDAALMLAEQAASTTLAIRDLAAVAEKLSGVPRRLARTAAKRLALVAMEGFSRAVHLGAPADLIGQSSAALAAVIGLDAPAPFDAKLRRINLDEARPTDDDDDDDDDEAPKLFAVTVHNGSRKTSNTESDVLKPQPPKGAA